MPYNFVADSFHTKKLCSRLSSSEVLFYTKNGPALFTSYKIRGGVGEISEWRLQVQHRTRHTFRAGPMHELADSTNLREKRHGSQRWGHRTIPNFERT